MATGTINFSPGSAVLPDGSAGNAAPALGRVQGTDANPKKHYLTLSFDATTDEHAWFGFQMPSDYTSGGVVRILWTANSLSAQNVVWGAKLGAISAEDADTPIEHAPAAATTVTTANLTAEVNRLNYSTITLGALDSVAASDLVFLLVYRDADNASDTLTVDASIINVQFQFSI